MIQQYRTINFRAESRDRIDKLLSIIEDYPDQKLTARQVYYQFVARGWLDNTVKNYKNLTSLLADARYAGLVDWEIIEDRGREPNTPSEWDGLGSLVDSALSAYRRPRWAGQTSYVELWVEKQALAGVLEPIARRFHATLMVNKGYSSASAMKESADRFIEKSDSLRIQPILLYLGDHDPSGEDMVRDIGDRLVEFGVRYIDVRKLALTMKQIRQFNPPPNPAKLTDSRAKGYIEKYGDQSWELDALPPDELNRLVTAAFDSIVDRKKMNEIIDRENRDKERLRAAVEQLEDEET